MLLSSNLHVALLIIQCQLLLTSYSIAKIVSVTTKMERIGLAACLCGAIFKAPCKQKNIVCQKVFHLHDKQFSLKILRVRA